MYMHDGATVKVTVWVSNFFPAKVIAKEIKALSEMEMKPSLSTEVSGCREFMCWNPAIDNFQSQQGTANKLK